MTLVIRGTNHPTKNASLFIRSHDMGGTDYEHLGRMTPDQAKSVLAGTNHQRGISPIYSHMHTDDSDLYGVAPARLSVSLRPDISLDTRPWVMHLVTAGKDPEVISYLRDDHIRQIQSMNADISYVDIEGQRDELEDTLSQMVIDRMRSEADKLQQERDERIKARSIEENGSDPSL
jgi:hypothetical protein